MNSENTTQTPIFDAFPYAHFPRTLRQFFVQGDVSGEHFFAPVFKFPDRFILDRLVIVNSYIFSETLSLRCGFTTAPLPHVAHLESCIPFFNYLFHSEGSALPVKFSELAQYFSPPIYQFFDKPGLKPIFEVVSSAIEKFCLRFDFYYLDLNPELHKFVSNDSTKKVAADVSKHD